MIIKYGYARLFLLFMICCNGITVTYSQADSATIDKRKLSAIYLGAGFGFGRNATPSGFSATFFLSNDWGASLSYKHIALISKDLPGDYISSSSTTLFSNSSKPESKKSYPRDFFDAYSLMIVREGHSDLKRIRFGAEFGPSWVMTRIAVFESQPIIRSGSSLFGFSTSSNYKVNYMNKQTIGLSLRGKLEFPLSKGLGLELALYGNINKIRSFAGVELYMTFGMVRR